MFSKLRSLLSRRIPAWSLPLAFLAVCMVSFGLLTPWLGFYFDDWEMILTARLFPVSEFWTFFAQNRPLSAWTYVVFTPLLGASPLPWHIFTLVLRWLTVVAMYWVFSILWPNARRPVTAAAFLFAIYPVFIQQPIAVTYHQVWMEYIFYFISLGAMIQAVRSSLHTPAFWGWSALAMLTLALNFSISEYFAGVELLRPVLLWIAMGAAALPPAKRLLQSLLHWLPYLAGLAGFAAWRFAQTPSVQTDANTPALLERLLQSPLGGLQRLVTLAGQDLLFIFTTAWYKTFQPTQVNYSHTFFIIALAVGAGLALSLYLYLRRCVVFEQVPSGAAWLWQMLAVGALGTLLGPAPVWITDRQAIVGMFSDRFSVTAMFGASLLLAVALEWLIRRRRQALVLSLIVGLAASYHLRVTNDYRWSWTNQQRAYWQLYWRAPDIQPGTLVMSEGDLFPFVRPTFPVNLLYARPRGDRQLGVWFYLLNREFARKPAEWLAGTIIEESQREFTFQGNSLNSLILHYNPPSQTDCLWVLSPDDADMPFLNDNQRSALSLVNLNSILPTPASEGYPPEDVFGEEPAHGWCYYYQKAELARQLNDWQAAADLGDQAAGLGFTPSESSSNTPREWAPFVEAYAMLGRWEEAAEIVQKNYRVDNRYRFYLCGAWQRVLEKTDESAERDRTTQEVISLLGCEN